MQKSSKNEFFKEMLFLATFTLFNSFPSLSSGADRVGNGGGFYEQQVLRTFLQIPKKIELCLSSPACLSSFSQILFLQGQSILYRMLNELDWASYRAHPGSKIQLLSARSHPEIFGTNSTQPYWTTKKDPGSVIYLNMDRLPPVEEELQIESLVFRMLFSGIGFQLGITDLLALDELAENVFHPREKYSSLSFSLERKMESAPMGYLQDDYLSAENWLKFFVEIMPELLQNCDRAPDCSLNPEEKRLLQDLIGIVRSEEYPADKLRFESGLAHPEIFLVDGIVKSAVTDLYPGAIIYFNLDHLYKVIDNRRQSVNSNWLFSLLIHELGHHTGVTDDFFLDAFSQKLTTWFENTFPIQVFQEDPDRILLHKPALLRSLILPSFSPNGLRQSSLFLADELRWHDWSERVRSLLQCSANKVLKEFRISKAQWNGGFENSHRLVLVPYPERGQSSISIEPIKYSYDLQATLICGNPQPGLDSPLEIEYFSSELKIEFIRKYEPNPIGAHWLPIFHYVLN